MFLVFVLAPLPSQFANIVDALWAGRYALLCVAVIALALSLRELA